MRRFRLPYVPPTLLLVILLGILLRLTPALFSVITGDVKLHLAYTLQYLRTPGILNLYKTTGILYHNTPVWIFILILTLKLSMFCKISFALLVKFWPLVADIGIMVLIWKIFSDKPSGSSAIRKVFLFAVNPVSILITAFHGQFDPVAVLFMLQGIYLINNESGGIRKLACLSLGFAIALKGFPVLMLPFFLSIASDRKEFWKSFFLMVSPSLVFSFPFLVATPADFFKALFLYSGASDFGVGGIGRLIAWAAQRFSSIPYGNLPGLFLTSMKCVFLSYTAYTFVQFSKKKISMYRASCAVYMGFLAIYPGISAQYFSWLIPLMLITENKHIVKFSIVTAIAVCGFYITYFPRILLGGMDLSSAPLWISRTSIWVYLVFNVISWTYLVNALFVSRETNG
jgi:hypothetical protein